MSRRRPPSSILLAALCLTVTQGCQDVAVTAMDVSSVMVSPPHGILFPDETLQLSATPRGPGGEPLDGRPVEWESEEPGVASVSASGFVTARAPGEARIVASSGGVTGAVVIDVRTRPLIVAEPGSLHLEGVAGEDAAAAGVVRVSDGEGAGLAEMEATAVYASGGPTGWIELRTEEDEGRREVVVTANAANLGPGTHQAAVRLEADGAENSPLSVPLVFEVAPAPPVIHLSSAVLGFVWEEGQPEPPEQSVGVTNGGSGQLTGLSASIRHPVGQNGGWLSAELEGSSAPTTLRVSVSPDAMETGVYDAFVRIDSPVAANGPREVRARLTVGNPPPELELDPREISLTITEGTTSPPAPSIQIENRGTGELGSLSASVSSAGGSPAWLEATLQGGSAPTTLTLSLVDTNLLPGSYGAEVEVSSLDAVNSPQTAEIELEVLPRASPTRSELEVQPNEITADGTSEAEVEVILRDGRGDRMPFGGNSVALSTTAGTLGPVTDHGDGRYTAALTAPTTAGDAVVTGTLDGAPLSATAGVLFRPGVPSPAESSLTATPDTLVADGESTAEITVTLRDAHGNPVVGGEESVSFSLAGGGSLSGSIEYDEGDGTYRTTLTAPSSPGEGEVTAAVNGQPIEETASFVYVVGAAAGATSTIEADPDILTADGEATSEILVRLRDAGGNLREEGGDEVVLEATAGTLGAVSDREDGSYAASLTAPTTTGTGIVTGTVNGEAISDSAVVTFVAGGVSPNQSSVVAEPAEIVADGSTAATVTVTLRDAEGNTITTGIEVSLAVEGAGSLSTDAPAFDPDSGTYEAFLTSTEMGEATLTTVAGGVTLEARPTVAFVAGAPSPSASSALVPDGAAGEETTIVISVRDAHGNPVEGQEARLAVSVSGANSASPAVTSLGSGEYAARYTPEAPGADQVAITLDGAPIAGSPFGSQVTSDEDEGGS